MSPGLYKGRWFTSFWNYQKRKEMKSVKGIPGRGFQHSKNVGAARSMARLVKVK